MKIEIKENNQKCPHGLTIGDIRKSDDKETVSICAGICSSFCKYRETEKNQPLTPGESFECSHPNGEKKKKRFHAKGPDMTGWDEYTKEKKEAGITLLEPGESIHYDEPKKTINLCELKKGPPKCEYIIGTSQGDICECKEYCYYKQKYERKKMEEQTERKIEPDDELTN
jgi:hypothetical protein